jgi:hypothetical protein
VYTTANSEVQNALVLVMREFSMATSSALSGGIGLLLDSIKAQVESAQQFLIGRYECVLGLLVGSATGIMKMLDGRMPKWDQLCPEAENEPIPL